MFKTIAIVAAIAFASVANAQVAQKNSIIVQTGINKVVAIQEKNTVKKNIVRAVYVADATRTNNMGTARMIGTNYIGTESGIEGVDFNRK